MPDFRPTFQDYLQFGQAGNDGRPPGTEEWWNSLSQAQQFQLLGGMLNLNPGDPRYQRFADLTHPEPNRNISVYGPGNVDGEINQRIVDPNRVFQGDGVTVTPWDNHTPEAQNNADRSIGPFLMGAGLLLGGGLGLNALMGYNGGGGLLSSLGSTTGGADIITPETLQTIPETTVNGMLPPPTTGGGSWFERLLTSMGVNPQTASTLNTGRQGLSAVNTVNNLINGGNTQTRTNNMSGLTDILSLLGGNNSGGVGLNLGNLLSILALGRSGGLFGGGIGTPEGALQAGENAANRADPWGASGNRSHFADLLTPDYVQSLLHPSPEDITNNPEYQFQLHEGTNAINVGDAAQGTLHSGNRLYELQRYGQGLATNFEQRNFMNNQLRLNQLENLGGVNASNPAAAALAMMGAFQGATSLQNNALNPLLSLFGGSGNGGGIGGLLSLLGSAGSGISSIFSSLFGGTDWNGMNQDDIWNAIFGSSNISNNLFPGDGDGGLGIWDALVGP